jgi:hypothetical protein
MHLICNKCEILLNLGSMSNNHEPFSAYCTRLHAATLRGITLNFDAKCIDFFAFVQKSAHVMEWGT